MRRKRKALDFHLDIAPVNLIDLLLVLLIFFVTTTSFLQMQVIDLTLPSADASQKIDPKRDSHVINIDLTCKLFLDRQAIEEEALLQQLEALKEASPSVRFRVGADAASPHECFVRVLDLLQKARIDAISILTKPERAKE